MALRWNVDQIKDHENVCWIEAYGARRMNPVTETLIFGTMMVGLGEITDKNVDEFVARFRILERLQGPFLNKGDGEPWYLSDEDFIAHIGLFCNVSNETRTKWVKRTFSEPTSITDDIARSFRLERAKVKVT